MSEATASGTWPRRGLCLCLLLSSTLLLNSTSNAAKPGSDPEGDSVDLGCGYVENMGLVSAGDQGTVFTNEAYRHLGVSIGQLGGVNPETGFPITSKSNLLPLVIHELETIGVALFRTNIWIEGDTVIDGVLFGSAVGLSNIPSDRITGSLTERPEIQEIINSIGADITTLQVQMEQSDSSTDNPHQVSAEQLGALACSGGCMTGDIDMSGAARVINLPEPLNNEDAVSKAYLEKRLNHIEPQGDIGMGIYTNHPGF
ncbi:MAG: hypothetical protein ACO20W_10760, partial [Anaerohalosphaeraceae bacterium]